MNRLVKEWGESYICHMEPWKKISGFDYEVNESGEVKRGNRILKPYIGNGYYKYDLYQNSKRLKCYAHRLVLSSFMGKCFFKGAVCNHKDGNKLNNHYTNLEWVTYSENSKHAYRVLGRKCPHRPSGSKSCHARAILQLDMNGNIIRRHGAVIEAIKEFGICVERCLSGKNKTAYGFKWVYAD